MTDDVEHIRTALLTFFYRQMPEIIEAGIFISPSRRCFGRKKEIYLKDGSSETYLKDERSLSEFSKKG